MTFDMELGFPAVAERGRRFEILIQDGAIAVPGAHTDVERLYGDRVTRHSLVLQVPNITIWQLTSGQPSSSGIELEGIATFERLEVGAQGVSAEVRRGKNNALFIDLTGFDNLSAGDLLSLKHRGYFPVPLILYYTSDHDAELSKARNSTARSSSRSKRKTTASVDDDEWEMVQKLHPIHLEAFVHMDCRVPTNGDHPDVAWYRGELDRQIPRLRSAHTALVAEHKKRKAEEEKKQRLRDRQMLEEEERKATMYEEEQKRLAAMHVKRQSQLAEIYAEQQRTGEIVPTPRTGNTGVNYGNHGSLQIMTPRLPSSGSSSSIRTLSVRGASRHIDKVSVNKIDLAEVKSLDFRNPGPILHISHTPLAGDNEPILDSPKLEPERMFYMKRDIVEHQLRALKPTSDLEDEIALLKLRILKQLIFKKAHEILGTTHEEREVYTYCELFPRLWDVVPENRFAEKPPKLARGSMIVMTMNMLARGLSSGPAGDPELRYIPPKPKIVHSFEAPVRTTTRYGRTVHVERPQEFVQSSSLRYDTLYEGVNRPHKATWVGDHSPRMMGIPVEPLSPREDLARGGLLLRRGAGAGGAAATTGGDHHIHLGGIMVPTIGDPNLVAPQVKTDHLHENVHSGQHVPHLDLPAHLAEPPILAAGASSVPVPHHLKFGGGPRQQRISLEASNMLPPTATPRPLHPALQKFSGSARLQLDRTRLAKPQVELKEVPSLLDLRAKMMDAVTPRDGMNSIVPPLIMQLGGGTNKMNGTRPGAPQWTKNIPQVTPRGLSPREVQMVQGPATVRTFAEGYHRMSKASQLSSNPPEEERWNTEDHEEHASGSLSEDHDLLVSDSTSKDPKPAEQGDSSDALQSEEQWQDEEILEIQVTKERSDVGTTAVAGVQQTASASASSSAAAAAAAVEESVPLQDEDELLHAQSPSITFAPGPAHEEIVEIEAADAPDSARVSPRHNDGEHQREAEDMSITSLSAASSQKEQPQQPAVNQQEDEPAVEAQNFVAEVLPTSSSSACSSSDEKRVAPIVPMLQLSDSSRSRQTPAGSPTATNRNTTEFVSLAEGHHATQIEDLERLGSAEQLYVDSEDDQPHTARTAGVKFSARAHLALARENPWVKTHTHHKLPHTIHKLRNTHSVLVRPPKSPEVPERPFQPDEFHVKRTEILASSAITHGPFNHTNEVATPFQHSNVLTGRNTYGKNLTRGELLGPEAAIFAWELRKLKIVEEVLRNDPTVFAVQECDQYHDFLKPFLAELGYQGMFCPKSNSACLEHGYYADGVALFWKYDAFVLKERYRGLTSAGSPCVLAVLEFYDGDHIDKSMHVASEAAHHGGNASPTIGGYMVPQDHSANIEHGGTSQVAKRAQLASRNTIILANAEDGDTPRVTTPRIKVSWSNSFGPDVQSPFNRNGSTTAVELLPDTDEDEASKVVRARRDGKRRVIEYEPGYIPPRKSHQIAKRKQEEGAGHSTPQTPRMVSDIAGMMFANARPPRLSRVDSQLPPASTLFSRTAEETGHLRYGVQPVHAVLPGGNTVETAKSILDSVREKPREPILARPCEEISLPDFGTIFQGSVKHIPHIAGAAGAAPHFLDQPALPSVNLGAPAQAPALLGSKTPSKHDEHVKSIGSLSAKEKERQERRSQAFKKHKKEYIMVCTTQLRAGINEELRRVQVEATLDQMDVMRMAFESEYGRKLDGTVLLGDLNCNPFDPSGAVETVLRSAENFQSAYDLPGRAKDLVTFGGPSRGLKVPGKCPATTVKASGKKDMTDYIFTSGFNCISRLWMPFEDEAGDAGTSLPSKAYPSDHFAIAAQLSFRKDSPRTPATTPPKKKRSKREEARR